MCPYTRTVVPGSGDRDEYELAARAVARDELADVVRPFGESRMLPARAYTAPEVLAWERRHLCAGTWSCVGRADELDAAHAHEGQPAARA
jgi:hypothetical protein